MRGSAGRTGGYRAVVPGRRPFPLADLVPDVLRDVILDFHWDLARLWRLDPPVTMVPLAELRWQLELPLWQCEGVHFAVSPAAVAADPVRFHEQWTRTLAADLRHPVHVLARPGRLTILDGAHRLLKAQHLGYDTVAAHLVAMDRLDEIAVPA